LVLVDGSQNLKSNYGSKTDSEYVKINLFFISVTGREGNGNWSYGSSTTSVLFLYQIKEELEKATKP